MAEVDDDVQEILDGDDADASLERKVVGLPSPSPSPSTSWLFGGSSEPPSPEEVARRRRADALREAILYGRKLKWSADEVVVAARAFASFIEAG